MTNSEAKEVFKKLDYNCARCRRELSPICDEAKNIAISALEENDKLKAEIDEWKKTVEYHRKKLLEFNNDNADLKAEIEQLKRLSDQQSELNIEEFKQIDSQYQEIEQLKSELERVTNLMPKICETCKYEDEIGWKEPCNNCKNGNNWKQKGKV